MSEIIIKKSIGKNSAPLLVGDKVTLRSFTEEDITAEYVAWLNDARITQYSEQRHRTHTFTSCLEYYKEMQSKGNFFWAIMANEPNKKHIGNMTAYLDSHNMTADLAIMLGDLAIQGKGYGREAWLLASNYLLDSEKLRKITAGTMSKNAAMLKIMHSTGMLQEGCKRRQFLLDGEEVDLIFMARFAKN